MKKSKQILEWLLAAILITLLLCACEKPIALKGDEPPPAIVKVFQIRTQNNAALFSPLQTKIIGQQASFGIWATTYPQFAYNSPYYYHNSIIGDYYICPVNGTYNFWCRNLSGTNAVQNLASPAWNMVLKITKNSSVIASQTIAVPYSASCSSPVYSPTLNLNYTGTFNAGDTIQFRTTTTGLVIGTSCYNTLSEIYIDETL